MSYIYKRIQRKKAGSGDLDAMSAGFCTAYYDILNKDLRHIHSGCPPADVQYRVPTFHQGIDVFQRMREQRARRRVFYLPRKHFEYLESYNICIPRAPAYRTFTKTEIESLVYRLNVKNDPTITQRHHINAHDRANTKLLRSKVHSAPVSYGRGSLAHNEEMKKKQDATSKEHVSAIVQRLHHGQTHLSKLRQREAVLSPRCKSAPVANKRTA